jgi:hypothetical protein
MKAYFVKLGVPLSEALEKIKKYHAIIIKPELGYSEKLLNYSYFIAFKCFRKKSRSKTLEIEWLEVIACTNSVEKAIEFTKPDGKACIASPVRISGNVLKQIGVPYKERKSVEKLAAAYKLKIDKSKVESAVEQRMCLSKMLG